MYVHFYIQGSTRQGFLNCCISASLFFWFSPDHSATFLYSCGMVKTLIDAGNLLVVLTRASSLKHASGYHLCICSTLRCESLARATVFFFSAGH